MRKRKVEPLSPQSICACFLGVAAGHMPGMLFFPNGSSKGLRGLCGDANIIGDSDRGECCPPAAKAAHKMARCAALLEHGTVTVPRRVEGETITLLIATLRQGGQLTARYLLHKALSNLFQQNEID